jgi:hypothetical protein
MTATTACARAAQRSLAQALAHSLGPLGIHFGVIVEDASTPLGIEDIAWLFAHPDREASTFEIDARPFGEAW